jgi:hypothetical protein
VFFVNLLQLGIAGIASLSNTINTASLATLAMDVLVATVGSMSGCILACSFAACFANCSLRFLARAASLSLDHFHKHCCIPPTHNSSLRPPHLFLIAHRLRLHTHHRSLQCTQAPPENLSDGVTSQNQECDEGVECIEDCDDEYEDEDDEQSETDEEDEESYYE